MTSTSTSTSTATAGSPSASTSPAKAAVASPAIRPGSLSAWILAMRPRTLPVSLAPVLVGTAVAHQAGGVRVGPALAAAGGALLLQIGSNLANDVFDYEKGADTAARIGPPRATQLGLLSPRAMKRGMVVVFGLAIAIGVYLTAVAGPVIPVIGLVSIAAAIAYTGGPWPLGYHGLGDVAVFVFFGVVAVAGTAFVQLGHVPPLAWMASIPVGALATAILVVNNLRDVDTDRSAGKRTLAVRLGRSGARAEWTALVASAYLIASAVGLAFDATLFAALPWLTLPKAIALGRVLHREEAGPPLNAALAGTAQLCFLFSLLFAAGLAA
ncbi:MAG: 1,4-dihydroxy-2-naphthoate polyprenyltransferase [Deltaproteobacteria bacterium]|nr:1,4-dihydroxy-2-naphthoate polyprenyltransferase [Deltaproteobacteria bacterium]